MFHIFTYTLCVWYQCVHPLKRITRTTHAHTAPRKMNLILIKITVQPHTRSCATLYFGCVSFYFICLYHSLSHTHFFALVSVEACLLAVAKCIVCVCVYYAMALCVLEYYTIKYMRWLSISFSILIFRCWFAWYQLLLLLLLQQQQQQQ